MRRGLAVLLMVGAMTGAAQAIGRQTNIVEGEDTARLSLVKRRKANKMQKALDRFYGYPSFRKGKGEKKRNASDMHKRGWK